VHQVVRGLTAVDRLGDRGLVADVDGPAGRAGEFGYPPAEGNDLVAVVYEARDQRPSDKPRRSGNRDARGRPIPISDFLPPPSGPETGSPDSSDPVMMIRCS